MPVTLCFIKDKHKVMEHKIPLETYFAELLQKVEWQIQEYEDTAADTLTLCRLCVDYLQEILGELENLYNLLPVRQHGRRNTLLQGTETAFSEQNHLLQYRLQDRGALPQRQRGRAAGLPAVGNRPDFKVVPAELGVLPVPPNESHLLDRQYFIRGKPDIQIIVDSFYYETDPQFSTSHDFKVAKILANELLEIYLTNRLHELERREQRKRVKNGFMGRLLRWTGTKRALVELIYALDACGCLNKGTVDIKEIVAYFEYVFDIDLGDFYHTYMELKAKTKDRTGFLSTLKDRLLMRMREQD